MTTVLDRIDLRRQAVGLTDAALARKAGIAEKLLGMARARKQTPKLDTLEKLALALDCTVAELIGEASPSEASAKAGDRLLVAWSRLRRSALNPRPEDDFDAVELDELAASIEAHGVLQNLVVRPLFAGQADSTLEVVAGERRYRAIGRLVKAGRWNAEAALVPVRIVEAGDGDARALAILENVQRRDIPPLAEAQAFAKLMEIDRARWTTTAIAASIGKTARHVQLRLELLTRLTPEAQAALAKGTINLATARALTAGTASEQKRELKAIEQGWGARTAEDLQRRLVSKLPRIANAIFDRALYTAETIKPEAGHDNAERAAEPALFWRLQDEAIKARIEMLKGRWAFVERRSGYVKEWDFEKSKDKAKAGAVLWIDRSTGKVEIHTGLVPRQNGQSAAEAHAQRKRDEAEQKARKVAMDELLPRLRTGLIANPTIGRALQLADCIERSTDRRDRDTVLQEWAGRLRKRPAETLDALASLDDAKATQLFARTTAADTWLSAYRPLNEEESWLCDQLGIDIPPALKPGKLS